jgi:hypothetical protein
MILNFVITIPGSEDPVNRFQRLVEDEKSPMQCALQGFPHAGFDSFETNRG